MKIHEHQKIDRLGGNGPVTNNVIKTLPGVLLSACICQLKKLYSSAQHND